MTSNFDYENVNEYVYRLAHISTNIHKLNIFKIVKYLEFIER